MNKCIICNETYETPDCKNCGKHIFSDTMNLVTYSQAIPAQIHVSEKKILINNFHTSGIAQKNTSYKRAFASAGLIGMLISMVIEDSLKDESFDSNSEIRIILNTIQKIKINDRKGQIILTVNKLNAKMKYILHIPNNENRHKLVALLKK